MSGGMSNGAGTALALSPQASMEVAPGMTLQETFELGKVLAASGFFADAREAAQAVTKVLAGRELGIAPVASLTGIYIVKGRVTLGANLIAAQVKRSGRYDYRVKELTDAACEIVFFEGGKECGVSRFTKEDATKAGLMSSDTYQKFPRNMLYARAISNGARWYAPDIFSGPIYTPDELGAEIEMSEGGELLRVKDVTPTAPVASSEGQASQDAPDLAAAKKTCAAHVKRLKLRESQNQWLVEAIRSLVVPEWDGEAAMTVLQYKRLNDRLSRFKSPDDAASWVELKKDEARKEGEGATQTAPPATASGEPSVKVFDEKDMTFVQVAEANAVAQPSDALFGAEEGEGEGATF